MKLIEITETQYEKLLADSRRLDWLSSQLSPGCFYTLNHHEHASQFYGEAPKGWSKHTPIGLGEFPEHFGATLREAIDSALNS